MSKDTIETTSNNPYGIKTPTNVNEFRENLRKYYVCIGRGNPKGVNSFEELPIENLMLYVQGKEIPLMDISSFDDIYKIMEMGFYQKERPKIDKFIEEGLPLDEYISRIKELNPVPMISPKIEQITDISDWCDKTDQFMSSSGYFQNEENFKVYENQEEFRVSGHMMWYGLDNQHLREFYYLTLGEFCGYELKENE